MDANLQTLTVLAVMAAIIVIIAIVLMRNKSQPASVRVVMGMAWLSAVVFAIDVISWVAVRPWMSGEGSAIPVSFVTAVDNNPGLNQDSWQSLQQVHHAANGGTLLMNFGSDREFLAYGFSPGTTAALIATPALMSALGAYLSWLVYRLARSVLEGDSFTTTIIRQVNRATIVITVVAVAHELVRLVSINGIYAEITEGSVAIRSVNPDLTLLLVAVGVAAFGQLLKSGIAMARETEGLI